MITEQELQAAIAECLGERDPDAHTCYKLAAYFTIQHELFRNPEQIPTTRGYSAESGGIDTVTYSSESEFGQAVSGMNSVQAWSIIEELMATLYAIDKPLYRSVMRRLSE